MIEATPNSSQPHDSNQANRPSQHHALTTTITCAICQAVYAPSSPQQPSLHTSPFESPLEVAHPLKNRQVSRIALESAFMSMCHFCFRCRRAACPECWDHVHGVCGACAEEAHLPFRTELAPLDGVLFPPPYPTPLPESQDNPPSSLLTCVHPGRFQVAASQPEVDPITEDDETTIPLTTLKQHEQRRIVPQLQEEPASIGLQEVYGRGASSGDPRARPGVLQKEPAPIVLQEYREEDDVPPVNRRTGVLKIIERVLTVITLLILLTIAALIILAEYSPAANTQIMHILHIDIRAEIAYLWQLIGQLFKG